MPGVGEEEEWEWEWKWTSLLFSCSQVWPGPGLLVFSRHPPGRNSGVLCTDRAYLFLLGRWSDHAVHSATYCGLFPALDAELHTKLS